MSFKTENRRLSWLFLTVILTHICTSIPAEAQRTMKGQSYIGGQCVMSCDARLPVGGEITFGRYMLDSHVKGRISLCPDSRGLSSSHRMSYLPVTVGADWMYRAAETYSRDICLYVGGGIFLGWEFYDPLRRLPRYIDTGLGRSAFIYGVSPKIEAEFFISTTVAIIIGAAMPVAVSSGAEIVRTHLGTGIRINI